MPLIRCKLGFAETELSGSLYAFEPDEYGRNVCAVDNMEHVNCLISCGTYEEVSEHPDVEPAKPKAKKTGNGGRRRKTAAEEAKQGEAKPGDGDEGTLDEGASLQNQGGEKTEESISKSDDKETSVETGDTNVSNDQAGQSEIPEVNAKDLRDVAAAVRDGTLQPQDGLSKEDYAAKLEQAADRLEAPDTDAGEAKPVDEEPKARKKPSGGRRGKAAAKKTPDAKAKPVDKEPKA